MSSLPTSAEELYDLVCSLQHEQQTTQIELRALHSRSEKLRGDIAEHRSAIAEERQRREEWVGRLSQLRASARRQQVEEEGAVDAAQDAVRSLCAEQRALLRTHFRDTFLNSSHNIDSFKAQSNDDAFSIGEAGAASRSMEESNDSSRFSNALCTSLYSGAALHSLLLALRAKLLMCVEAAAAEEAVKPASCVRSAEEADANPMQPPHDAEAQHVPQPAVGSFTDSPWPLSAAHTPLCRETDSFPSAAAESAPAAAATATPIDMPSQGQKKHIGFASDAFIQRVTPVPASNVNRGLSPALCKGLSHAAASLREGTSATTLSTTSASRGPTKFTVRVASRSSTLLAEAAALGAQRQRTHQAARTRAMTLPVPTQEASATTSTDSTQSPSSQASMKRIELLPGNPAGYLFSNVKDVCSDARCTPGRSDGASALTLDSAAPSVADKHERYAIRFAAPAGLRSTGPRVSSSGGTAPRRTVWTLSRDGATERQQ